MNNNCNIITDIKRLEKKACQIRATCIQMAHDGKAGHLNGALSSVDILISLYYGWLKVNPTDYRNKYRDRFIFSNGHDCTALYAVMADRGFFPLEMLSHYAETGSPLAMHPCVHMLPQLEFSSGSLGHGLGVSTGISVGLKLKNNKARVVVLISDGESNEGSVWEAAMFAAAKKLDNLLVIVDYNHIQAVGRSDEIMGHTSLESKFKSFGWSARTIDGHNTTEIINTLNNFPFESKKPSAIIAKTIAGAGVSFMENQVLWHYRVPSLEDLENALDELNAKPIHLV